MYLVPYACIWDKVAYLSKCSFTLVGVGKALTELGKVYLEQDFRIKALEAFEQSYRIHKDFYSGQDHPDVSPHDLDCRQHC